MSAAEQLDGLDAAAVGLNRERAAGAGREPVKQDGAGAAHAVFTSDMRAGQADLVADEVGQKKPRLDPPPERPAVDGHVDLRRVHCLLVAVSVNSPSTAWPARAQAVRSMRRVRVAATSRR